MKRYLTLWIVFALVLGVQAEKLRVLFVGNSYTFVNNVPEQLKVMAASKGHELEYESQTPGGRSFQKHWEEKKAVEKMKEGGFDIVIFQGQSYEPVSHPANMMKYGKLLAAEADTVGARKIYYLTMAYKEPLGWMKKDRDEARRSLELYPDMQDRLTKSYANLAHETKGEVAPVGVAWQLAYESIPNIMLHAADHSHASETGAYLAALVFYSTIYGEAPTGMPEKLEVESRKKGKTVTTEITINSKTRKALEAVAWKACQEFRNNLNGEMEPLMNTNIR